MPKAGETPDMGSNPLLGFGRVYARPSVAKWLDQRVHRFINDPSLRLEGVLDRARRVADHGLGRGDRHAREHLPLRQGGADGADDRPPPLRPAAPGRAPLRGLHGRHDAPEGGLRDGGRRLGPPRLPHARASSSCRRSGRPTPASSRGDVHVWTLGGPTRVPRIGKLWEEWKALGAHLVEDGWLLPSGLGAFTDSGTYAPTYRVGPFTGPDGRHAPLHHRRLRRLGRGAPGGEPRPDPREPDLDVPLHVEVRGLLREGAAPPPPRPRRPGLPAAARRDRSAAR